jgi:hypothetical protein
MCNSIADFTRAYRVYVTFKERVSLADTLFSYLCLFQLNIIDAFNIIELMILKGQYIGKGVLNI